MTDWQQPQKQSAPGIFLFAAKTFRGLFAFLLIIIGSLTRKQKPLWIWLVTVGGITVFVFGKAILEYFYFSFYVSEGQLIIKKGILEKKTLVVPLERIQTVQLEQSFFHRIIHHFRVTIDTAGTEKTEVTIHSLSYNKALELKQLLTSNMVQDAQQEVKEDVIHFSASDLFKLAISHNHLETFALIIAFVLARFEDVKDLLGFSAYDWMQTHGKEVVFTTKLVGISIFFALAFAILISVMRIVLKFSNLVISFNKDGFQVKYGLLHSRQQFIGARKIQFIEWKANWIRRKIGMYMFYVKTAGEADLKNKQKIHVPVTREEHIQKLALYYQSQTSFDESPVNRIQPQYVFRRTLIIGLPVTIAITSIAFTGLDWYALWLGLLLPYFFARNLVYKRNYVYRVNNSGIEISSGVWGRKTIIFNWHKLQAVTIRQGIYQRKKQLANLMLRTASGDVTLPYIKLEEARMLADYAAMKTESSAQGWM